MRKYDYLLTHIGMIGGEETIDGIVGLAPFMVGAVLGLALFSRFLSWLLSKYHAQTIALLIGFLIGSLFVIWPFQHREYIEQVRETEWVSSDNEQVRILKENPNENLPEFNRLGVSNRNGEIAVLTIKKKMIKSEPYIPGSIGSKEGDNPNVFGGVAGMLLGVLMVSGLDRLRDIKS
jgi:putative membrane protein